MEAAALYTFARMRNASLLCLAHVTNTMGQIEGDFEKGPADGTTDALKVLACAVKALFPVVSSPYYVDHTGATFLLVSRDSPRS
jgi:hypothetical protein